MNNEYDWLGSNSPNPYAFLQSPSEDELLWPEGSDSMMDFSIPTDHGDLFGLDDSVNPDIIVDETTPTNGDSLFSLQSPENVQEQRKRTRPSDTLQYATRHKVQSPIPRPTYEQPAPSKTRSSATHKARSKVSDGARYSAETSTWNRVCTANLDNIKAARLVLGHEPWAGGEQPEWPNMRYQVSTLENKARPYYGGPFGQRETDEDRERWYGKGFLVDQPTEQDMQTVLQSLDTLNSWIRYCSNAIAPYRLIIPPVSKTCDVDDDYDEPFE